MFLSTPSLEINDVDSAQNDDDDDDSDDTIQAEATSFESLGLSAEILQAIRSQPDWITPTPIQRLAIPQLVIARNDDDNDSNTNKDDDVTAVGCLAPTGSGKTAAFALPLLDRLLLQQQKQKQNTKNNTSNKSTTKSSSTKARIASLVLCPTRELAVQIGRVFQNLAYNLSTSNKKQRGSWNIMTIYGGVPLEPQISALASYAQQPEETIDVLIATPGRLCDVLTYYNHDAQQQQKAQHKNDSELQQHHQQRRRRPDAQESALERRLLQAMDATGKNTLKLSTIEDLKLDRQDDEGRSRLSNLLDGVEIVVLDEADRLLSRAFAKEMDAVLDLLPVTTSSNNNNKKHQKLQTWLFSATFPKAIEPRIDQVLKRLGGPNAKPPIRISCAASDRVFEEDEETVSTSLQKRLAKTSQSSEHQQKAVGPASTIQLRTLRLHKRDRTQALRQLLTSAEGRRDWDRVLVFVSTRYASEHVARKLRRAGIKSAELHGKLDQDARIRRLSDFAKGKVRVLLATDVASRGLDVKGLPLVVNYDLPRSPADFVHRIGRTGRAGREGTAISFVTAETEAHLDLIEKRHLREPVEREILAGFEVDEEEWRIQSEAARIGAPGTAHSAQGLAHDRMVGGVKGRRKSKKDRLREKAAREALEQSKEK